MKWSILNSLGQPEEDEDKKTKKGKKHRSVKKAHYQKTKKK